MLEGSYRTRLLADELPRTRELSHPEPMMPLKRPTPTGGVAFAFV